MAAPILKLGTDDGVVTGTATEIAERNRKTVTVEGTLAVVEALCENPSADIVPDGYEPVRGAVTPTGDGMGRLTLVCVKYDEESTPGGGFAPVRATVEVDMEEVTYDLVDHPSLAAARDKCRKWLATDEAKRAVGAKYYYTDATGQENEIEDDTALKFCAAYMAGIHSFVRYYPVIVRKSVYKNPPGLTRSGRSFPQGTPMFSSDCGTFSSPPITLSGYPGTNWFKSGDIWHERGDTTWERQEKWTYTPDGSGGSHAWIYQSQTQQGGGS